MWSNQCVTPRQRLLKLGGVGEVINGGPKSYLQEWGFTLYFCINFKGIWVPGNEDKSDRRCGRIRWPPKAKAGQVHLGQKKEMALPCWSGHGVRTAGQLAPWWARWQTAPLGCTKHRRHGPTLGKQTRQRAEVHMGQPRKSLKLRQGCRRAWEGEKEESVGREPT